MKTSRKYYIDNIRAILIFLVVLGHLFETVDFPLKSFFYNGIYIFHIPAFAFISGMCHKKFTGEKILLKFFLPYLFFQIVYVLFENKVMYNSFEMQFAMPFWILWYLIALFCWNVFSEALSFKNLKRMGLMLIFLICISLLAGYDDTIGFYLSISRTIVFFPFYYAGIIFIQVKNDMRCGSENKFLKKGISLLLIICCSVVIFVKRSEIESIWLQGTTSYSNGNYNIWIRGMLFIGAIIWILFLLEWVKNKEYPVMTRVGQNTYLIFLLHGFFVRGLSLVQWSEYLKNPVLACFIMAVGIVLGLGYASAGLKKIKEQRGLFVAN